MYIIAASVQPQGMAVDEASDHVAMPRAARQGLPILNRSHLQLHQLHAMLDED